jgi:hypothetical protein
METDILIAGLMVLATIGALLGIIVKVGRAVREEPRHEVERPQAVPAPPLRHQPGW